jgi:hypothetical protein
MGAVLFKHSIRTDIGEPREEDIKGPEERQARQAQN